MLKFTCDLRNFLKGPQYKITCDYFYHRSSMYLKCTLNSVLLFLKGKSSVGELWSVLPKSVNRGCELQCAFTCLMHCGVVLTPSLTNSWHRGQRPCSPSCCMGDHTCTRVFCPSMLAAGLWFSPVPFEWSCCGPFPLMHVLKTFPNSSYLI
jgi:hypothetical protein